MNTTRDSQKHSYEAQQIYIPYHTPINEVYLISKTSNLIENDNSLYIIGPKIT